MKMLKKLLCLAGLFGLLHSQAQDCPQLVSPVTGSTGVSVSASITWETITGVPGYIVSLGTTPGGSEILSQSVGGATTFTPPQGLPENTQVYVTVTLFFFDPDQDNIECTLGSFNTEDVTTPPNCTALVSPVDGTTNVPVATNLQWAYSPTATGYRLAIGTSPGGTEILPLTDVMNTLSYSPAADLPPETDIYVRVIPYNENGDAISCSEERFTTGALATLPGCTVMLSPGNGAINVPLSPTLVWNPVPGADGYLVTIGTSPFDSDVLDNVRFTTTSTNVINFEPNSIYYIRVVPFNTAGEALGCTQETFSTILGCGPYFDALTGELVDLHPANDFPASVGICLNDPSSAVSATNTAEGYRWYSVDTSGRETLLAETETFDIPGAGTFRHEIYNNYTGPSGDFECATSVVFTAVASEAPNITGTDVQLGAGVITITTQVSGSGDYEYALDDPAGPYQASNRFSGLPLATYRIYVRDKNGCGTADILVEPDVSVEGFPKFFTPNGDGRNDRWQFIIPESGSNPLLEVAIFDRYGNLLARIPPESQGWDGTVGGRPMPPSDYWFRAVDRNGGIVQGHFALKR